jgi:hypothetical protein
VPVSTWAPVYPQAQLEVVPPVAPEADIDVGPAAVGVDAGQ